MPRKIKRPDRTLAVVDRLGIAISIKQRKNQRNYVLEYAIGDERIRQSSRTSNLANAEALANTLALELAKKHFGRELGFSEPRDKDLDLGSLFRRFRNIRLRELPKPREGLTASHGTQLDVAMRALVEHLGEDFKLSHFDQNVVNRHVQWRAARGQSRHAANNHGGVPASQKTGARDFGSLSEIIAWGMKTRINGELLLTYNPLAGLTWPSAKKDCMRPVTSEQRLHALLEAAPQAERKARDNCTTAYHMIPGSYDLMVRVLADYGQRLTATGLLRRGDVLLTPHAIEKVAASLGRQPEECASAWMWGALYFRAENSKMSRATLVPLTKRMRARFDAHLAAMDAAGRASPEDYLFCMPTNPRRPLVGSSAANVLLNIEAEARNADGEPLVHLARGNAHPLRRRFRSIRAGRFDDALVAIAGGWTLAGLGGDTSVMNHAYLKYPPESLLHCLEFDPCRDLDANSLPPGVRIRVNFEG